MLAKPRRGSKRRFIAALVLALGVAACATQIEPPVIVGSSAPAVAEISDRLHITARRIELRTAEDGTVQIDSVGEGVLHFFPDQGQMTADRVTLTADGLVFEGNVQIEHGGTSIATNRAVFKEAPDGSTTLSMDNAVVTRDEAR